MKKINYGLRRIGLTVALASVAVISASAQTNGTQVLSGQTIPRGGVWIPGALGGHFWTADAVNGICRLDGVGVTSNCDTTAKSAGQIVTETVGGVTPTTYVFVPDASTTSSSVVRYTFNTATETLNVPSALIINVPAVNTAHGGTKGGRPVALALDKSDNLYIGYLKAGDIMKVAGASTAAPVVVGVPDGVGGTIPSPVGSTSDGIGVAAIALHGNDLYLSELGGFGLSRIIDVSGVGRPACGPPNAICTASTVTPAFSFFPGGLASDGKTLYVADNPITTTGSIIAYNPVNQSAVRYSITVTPSYSFSWNGTSTCVPGSAGCVTTTYSQYVGAVGLGLAPATLPDGSAGFDLYVADDPTSNLIAAVLPTTQGHLWKVRASLPVVPGAVNGILTMSGSGYTVPRGGAWINAGGTLATTHLWTGDGNTKGGQGLCKVTGAAPAGCNGSAKGGQVAYAGGFIFIANGSSTGANQVMRFPLSATEALGASTTITVNPKTNPAASRPVAVAMAPNGQDLYVGYLTSGDIVKIAFATSATPGAQTLVAKTSDLKGVQALVFQGNDLYLAESTGVSKVLDPTNLCATTCTAVKVSVPGFATLTPGGLASDGTNIYIGNAPANLAGSVIKYNPAANTAATYSTAGTVAGVASAYVNIRGLAFASNGDVYVGDDPVAGDIAETSSGGGRLFRIPGPAPLLTLTGVFFPANLGTPINTAAAGSTVVITGSGFSTGGSRMTFTFNNVAGTVQGGACSSVTQCTVTLPTTVTGPVVIAITNLDIGSTITNVLTSSPLTFSYSFSITTAVINGAPTVTGIVPSIGLPSGGTKVTISGTNFGLVGSAVSARFGVTAVNCVVNTLTSCQAVTPPGSGTVFVQIITAGGVSATTIAGQFVYTVPTASLYAWGITAPKGGVTAVPGALGGHIWSSDHAQGFCRQDPMTGVRPLPWSAWAGGPTSWPGSATLHALALDQCDNGTIGSSGQAVVDPRPTVGTEVNATTGALVPAGMLYIYVPDNAVKSTAVWRLTYNPATETLLNPLGGYPPEAMVPLADVRTLKPNGMAIGPDGNLYISDLVEPNIRVLTQPNKDPRIQTIAIIGQTGDGRGANGTMGFIGNKVFIAENRAASWMDITKCTPAANCSTAIDQGPAGSAGFLPLPSGVFVGGVATDPNRNYLYVADSPGGANATIWRIDLATYTGPNTGTYIQYLNGGILPYAGTPESTVWISQGGVRPWNPLYPQITAGNPAAVAGFSFAFGIYVEPTSGDLYITGDPTAGARSGWGSAWVAKVIQ